MVSSEDASQSTPDVWESDSVDVETSPTPNPEINITHELARESIIQSTTERTDATTAESDLNNMSNNNTTVNDLSKDNSTRKITTNNNISEHNVEDNNTSKNDGVHADESTTENVPIDSEKTTITNFPTNQESTIFPSEDLSLQDSSTVQNSGQMVTKPESIQTEDSISSDDQNSNNTGDSTPVSKGNGNDHNERLQFLTPSHKNNQRFRGNRKFMSEDYLLADKTNSIDLVRILKLILEKQTLDLNSKILDMMKSTTTDGNAIWNIIHNVIALCLKSKGFTDRVHNPPGNWYNSPIPLFPPDVPSKTAFTEYLVSAEQPIKSTGLPVGSNIDTPMLDSRLQKAFVTSLIDIYDTEKNSLTEENPLTEVTRNNPSRIDHLSPCSKTHRNCFLFGGKIFCKSRVICRPSEIKGDDSVQQNGIYNLNNDISNFKNIHNLESDILSLKTDFPVWKNIIPYLKNAALLTKKHEDEMEGIEALLRLLMKVENEFQKQIKNNKMINSESIHAKFLSDAISKMFNTNPGIEITSDTTATHGTTGSSPTYVNPINDANPIFGTNTIDDATQKFTTNLVNPTKNTNPALGPNSIYISNQSQNKTPTNMSELAPDVAEKMTQDNLNSLHQLLNNLNNLNTLSSYLNSGSVSAKDALSEDIEGNKAESIGNKGTDQRALTLKPIARDSDTIPTLSVLTKPLSVSVNQSVVNEMTPTSKLVEPVESEPVATAKQFETVYPSVDQLVNLTNQPNEGSVSDSSANARKVSDANSLVNQSANFETKTGTINSNLDKSVITNFNKDLNTNTISKTNNILNAVDMNSSGISVDNSLGNIRQSLTTKPEATNSQHARMNLNQDSNMNINQDENVSKLGRGSIEQQLQGPIKMQLPVTAQVEHPSPVSGNTGTVEWNAKQDGSLDENRNSKTNVNQSVNTNQVNIVGLTHDLNPVPGSSNMNVNLSNDINRNVLQGNTNMVVNEELSRRTNSETGFQGQQISGGQTLSQGVSVGDGGAANTNLNYNANVNRNYNANLRQGDSLKMSESIRDIPTPTQNSKPLVEGQRGGKMNPNLDNNNGVNSNFRAHANFNLNLGKGFDMIKNVLSKNPLLSSGIISKRIMNLIPKDPNLQSEANNQNQNEDPNLNLNRNQNLHENENPFQSQYENSVQIQNSKESGNQNLNKILDVNLNEDENQISNKLPKQNEIIPQSQFLYQNEKLNQNLNPDQNSNYIQDENEKIQNSNQYSNQNLNQNLNANINHNENQQHNQASNQIQMQSAIHYQSQNQISNQLPSQSHEFNQNINSNLNQNQFQDQNQNEIRNRDANQYVNQNLNQNLNTSQNQSTNDNRHQNQIQSQNQIKEQNKNQYASQNENFIRELSTKLNQLLSQNLNHNMNLKATEDLNKNHLQYKNEIQLQSQSNNQIANQHLSQNENQSLNQNIKDNKQQHQNQNLNQIPNLNENQDLRRNLNPSQYQKLILNQIQNQNSNEYQNSNQYQNLDEKKIQSKIQNQFFNQDLRQNFSQNQNLNENLAQNVNKNQIQISDVNIDNKIQEKQKGWYELWYNHGEGKGDRIEIWNNKRLKRFRRETNHRRL